MACVLLTSCATPVQLDVLWLKEPGAVTRSERIGQLCTITTADRGEADAAEIGAALRRCLEAR